MQLTSLKLFVHACPFLVLFFLQNCRQQRRLVQQLRFDIIERLLHLIDVTIIAQKCVKFDLQVASSLLSLQRADFDAELMTFRLFFA